MESFDRITFDKVFEIFLVNDGFQSFELKLDHEKTLIEKTVHQE